MVQLVSIHFYFGKTKCYFQNALSETSKLERNPSRPFVPLICPVLTCLRRSLVFLHILSMATFKALLLSALSVCNQRERKQSVLVWDPSASTLCPQCIRAFGHSYMLKDFSNFSYIWRASTTASTECQIVMLSIICWIKTCFKSSIQEQNKHLISELL